MHQPHPILLLVPILALTACGQDQPPTAPAEAGGALANATAGHEIVNSLADPGHGACDAAECTLREAIDAPGSTTITFAPGLSGSITLARPAAGGGLLVIDKPLAITAPAAGIAIQRRSTDPAFRIFRLEGGANVTLSNLTIRNGKIDGHGGGIINFGTLVLSHCRVTGNSATVGGGIDNHGPLTLIGSTITDNSGGGLVHHDHGALTIDHSLVARNSGPGIALRDAALTLTNSTVAHNTGGGISGLRARMTITRATIVDNSTTGQGGGIITFNGTLTLTASTVARNSASDGGGLASRDGSTSTISRSTFAANSATDQGGGIFNRVNVRLGAKVTVINSTISGNSARSGGGIHNSGFLGTASVGLTQTTVARNSATQEGGGVLQVGDEAVLGLTNSLLARNTAPAGPDVLASQEGSVFARFTLIGDGTGSGVANTDGNQVGKVSPNSSIIDPGLGPLADNGGPTKTRALEPGSPAIDAASTPDCPATDQRAVSRPQGAACDIGSYERE